MCFIFHVVIGFVAKAMHPMLSSSILIERTGVWSRLVVSSQRKITSWTAAKIPMYSASLVERATVLYSLLPHTTSPLHFMAMKPVLERLMSPSVNEESYHIIGSKEMFPLKVRQNDLVPYLRTRLACAQ